MSKFYNNYAKKAEATLGGSSADANGAPASEEDQGPPFDSAAYVTSLLSTAPSTWKGPALAVGAKVTITAYNGDVCIMTFLGYHPEGSDIGWPVFDANLAAFVRVNPKAHNRTFEVMTA